MTCPDSLRLESFVTEGRDSAAIDAHLESCAACRSAVEDIRLNLDLLTRLDEAGLGVAEGLGHDAEIPGYELGAEIARGGQGIVFRATQTATRRPVAVKLLHAGAFATSRQRHRFDREVEIVSAITHPGVVTIYDSGQSTSGARWCAMQWIDGRTLDEHLAGYDPAEGGRVARVVALFVEICDAVAAAHVNGVIHRDLKPANVLVDSDGHPHVLDFGLARPVLDPDAPLVTREGALLGTLAYSAPEQIGGGGRPDQRSDVYALGVMLFEALAGRLPREVPDDLASFVRAVTEEDAPPLEARPGARFDRDLVTIVARTLARDPDRRYASAAALRDELRRYAAGRPIEARSDSAAYVLGKTLRAHRVPVGLAVLALVVLVAFSVTVWVLYDRARTEARTVRQINVFLEDTLGSVESASGAGGEVTVRELLDESVAWIDLVLADEPEVAASIRSTVGNAYRNLGAYDAADAQLTAALHQWESIRGADDLEVTRAMTRVGLLRRDQGRYEEAASLLDEALVRRRRALGPRAYEVTLALSNLAAVRVDLGALDEARDLLEEALDIRTELFGPEHQDVAMTTFRLAEIERRTGAIPRATELHRRVLDVRAAVLSPTHPDLARSHEALGDLLLAEGDAVTAVTHERAALQVRASMLAEGHWRLAWARGRLGRALFAAGAHDEAIPLLRDAVADLTGSLGPDDPRTRALHELTSMSDSD